MHVLKVRKQKIELREIFKASVFSSGVFLIASLDVQ